MLVIHGLELGESFYLEVAKPILEKAFPAVRYSAAMLGWSSEVRMIILPETSALNLKA